MVHDSQMSVRGQFVLLSSRLKIVALVLICNNQPELNVSHSMLATPSSAPTRDGPKLEYEHQQPLALSFAFLSVSVIRGIPEYKV